MLLLLYPAIPETMLSTWLQGDGLEGALMLSKKIHTKECVVYQAALIFILQIFFLFIAKTISKINKYCLASKGRSQAEQFIYILVRKQRECNSRKERHYCCYLFQSRRNEVGRNRQLDRAIASTGISNQAEGHKTY